MLSALLAVPLVLLIQPAATAADMTLFDQPFHNNTANGTGAVSLPAPGQTGTNVACLSAAGNSSTGSPRSCLTSTDAQGSGTLRLTDLTTSKEGGVFGATSVPTSQGIDATFNTYQYGGTSADGLAFVLAAVDPAAPLAPATMGPYAGSLGYSATATVKGVPYGYLGVGFDVYGNFSRSAYQGTGCTNPAYISTTTSRVAGQVVVRGPGNNLVGYCALNSTATTTASPALALRASTRTASKVPAEVAVNPTAASFTTASGLTVAAGTYQVTFTKAGGGVVTLQGALPTVAAGLYPASWLTADGVPRQLAFGWVGSTSTITDFHEVDAAKIVGLNPVPDLSVAQTSYSGSSPLQGDPVTYTVTSAVDAGSDETAAISVTETLPTGVRPLGAFGSGWVCQAPSGQKITCTNSNTPFTNGTSLSAITLVGVVTATGMTATTIQTGSRATASSNDANPGYSPSTTLGTTPAAPSGVTVTPAVGRLSGGIDVTVGGSAIAAANALWVGTTDQVAVGTATTLLPCPAGPAAGCFTVNGNGTLDISSMPAHAVGATQVVVVTQGVAGAATFNYADKPATVAKPTATAGVSSATLVWSAPASNNSAITSYTVTPYKTNVAQTPVVYDTSTTTRTLTGLTAGSSYTFTVIATNAVGPSTASSASTAVIPYAVPGQPTITAKSARTNGASLTWTAPAANGSAITGYVVVPYIAGAAQASQTFVSTALTQTVTGLTAGTPYTFTVAAQNAVGTGPASAVTTAVTPNVSPSLAFTAPPAGEVTAAYSKQLTVTGGTSPFVWSVSAGSLPPGLTLNAGTGLLSGTPTAAGSYPFTVQVSDTSSQTATQAVTLTVAAAPSLAFPAPPAGQVGIAYSNQLTVTGGTAPFAWSVSAGSLPPGVTLNAGSGLLSGTPTTAGSFSFTAKVTDAFSKTATKVVALVVAATPTLGFPAPPAGRVGIPYTNQLTVTGGTAPFAWSVSAGSLPPGLALNAGNGLLSGTPTITGSYSFTVRVIDANSQTATQAVTQTINPGALVLAKTADTTAVAPGGTVHYTITISNTSQIPFSGVTVSDPLTGVLDDATYNADAVATAGTTSFAGLTVSWTGDMAVGAVVTVSYSVTVANPDTGNGVLTNTVTSATLGNTCPAGGTDPSCTATVTVSGLTIVTTTDTPTATPGTTVQYTVTATNTGQTAYPAATFTDPLAGVLDDATYNADATASAGSVSFTSPTLTWTGNLAVGAAMILTYSVTVKDPDTGNRLLSHTIASTSPGSTCPSGGSDPRCTATVTTQVPELTITTAAATSATTPGGTVNYTMTITNTGETAYTGAVVNVSLTRVLTDTTYGADATATAGALSYTAPTLTWTGNLAIGATVTVQYSVTVLNPDPGDKVLVTTATSAAPGSTCPAGGTDPACSVTVVVLVPSLNVVNTAGVATTTAGSSVQYTLTVTNDGQTPQAGVTVTDPLGGLLDDATYSGDVAATAGTVGVAGSTLTWTGDLAVGAAATITFSVTVRNPDPGDNILTITAASTAVGSSCPVGSPEARCTATVPVAGLVISQSMDVTSTTPGSVIRLTATFVNTGQTPYTGISVSGASGDVLDDATANGDQVSTSGSTVLSASAITWTGSIPVGGTVTVTGTLTVRNPPPAPESANKMIHGTLVTTAAGSNCPAVGGTDPRCTVNVPVLIPGLTVVLASNTPYMVPGGPVGYTVTVTNNGQTPYTGATVTDTLDGLLDDAVYNGDAAVTTGTVTATANMTTSGTVTWTGNLAVGAVATITFSVTVRYPDPGDKVMANLVSSTDVGSSCLPASGASACGNVVAVFVPQLRIIASADADTATAGSTLHFTVTVTDIGVLPYQTAGATIPLPLDGAVYNGDAAATVTPGMGTSAVTATGPGVGTALDWSGSLYPGATATITYSVTVDNPYSGGGTLASTVVSSTVGNNCPAAGGTDPGCTATVPVVASTDLTFTNAADVESTTVGSVVHYTVTVANSAATPYMGAAFTLPLTSVLDDAGFNGDVSATAGTVGYTAPDVSWTGNVPAGGTVTVTFSATVAHPSVHNDILASTLVSASSGGNCAAGGTDPRCASRVTVSELVVASAATYNLRPGSVAPIDTTITNTGQTPYFGISVTLSAGGSEDDLVGNGDYVASSGSLILVPPSLTWVGDLPVGATVTLTGSITVNNPDTGDHWFTGRAYSDAPGSNCPVGSDSPACFVRIDILVPGLTVAVAADRTYTTPGGTITYTITATNTGQTPYVGAHVTASLVGALDDAVYTGDAAATTGTVGFAASVSAITWTGDLAVGATSVVTVTFSVVAHNPAVGDKTVVVAVSSTDVGSTCPTGGTAAACRSTVAVLTPILTIAATSDVATVAAGATVHYRLSIVNAGQLPYAGVTVAESLAGVLDDAVYNNDAAASRGTAAFAGTTLSWTGSLSTAATPATASATVTFSVTVARPDTGNRTLTTVATSTATGSNCPTGGSDPRCATAVPVAMLTIVNTADVATTTPTGVVRYTITITNSGQTPYFDISVAAELAAVLDDATYNGDISVSAGDIVGGGSQTQLVWNGDLAPGAAVTISGSVTVNNPDAGNKSLTSVVISTAPGNNCPAGGTDPQCTSVVTVRTPGLSITKTADTTTVTPGGTVGYTIVVANTGETPYVGATVTDPLGGVLNDGAYNNDATSTTGAVALAGSTLTWTGDLAVAATATISYTVTVSNPDTGDHHLVNTASSLDLGSTCPAAAAVSVPACSVEVTVLTPALAITVTADAVTTTPGSTVGFTVSVVNTGEAPYAGATVTNALAGLLDDAAYDGNAAATTGTVTFTAPTLTWTGNLAVAAAATITFSVTVDSPDAGDRTLTNIATSAAAGSTCPAGGTDPACTATVSVLVPRLVITKTADAAQVVDGDTVHYTITVANTGETPATATVADNLAGVLDDADYNADAAATAGTASVSNGTLSWTGPLAISATATITYSVGVRSPDPGDRTLTNTVTSATPGSTCPAAGGTPACTSTVAISAQTITLTDLTGAFTLSGRPNTTGSQDGAVSMTVTTNSGAGYQVTVQAGAPELTPSGPPDTDSIPTRNLRVRESGATTFQPLSATSPVLVHSQDHASAPGGDAVSNDYEVTIPFVDAGAYATTLDYVALTQ